MRILFSTDQIHLHGGIEKVMAVKANYFTNVLGYEVYILTTEQKGNAPCYQLSSNIKLVDIGINYHRKKSYFHPVNLVKIPKHFFLSKRNIRQINPDVIISCNYAFDFYWLPFIFRNIPKLKEFHSSRYFDNLARVKANISRKLKFWINDFIESKFTRLILLNPDEKPFYQSDNLEVIPNPIVIPEIKAGLQNKKIIAAGRIAPVKGFENLIRAWKLVTSAESEWQLNIYGNGESEYIESLKKQVLENHLENTLFIMPAISNLLDEMADSSIYVMSSVSECFPMVLLESLSVGLPIVSFNCPTGPQNIITDGKDGLLSVDQDVEKLAAKIVLLAKNPSLRKTMGENGKNNIQRFSPDNVMDKWRMVLESLVK